MENHEKLQKILEIRKRRERKKFKQYQEKQRELDKHEQELQNERHKIEVFMQQRTVELHTMQNRIRTEAVSGLVVEQYLMLKDDTQMSLEDMYKKLEEKSQAHYPLMDELKEAFEEWEKSKNNNQRLEKTADEKTDEFNFEKSQKAEQKMFDDFVFRPK